MLFLHRCHRSLPEVYPNKNCHSISLAKLCSKQVDGTGFQKLEATILYHNISSNFIVTISTIFHRTSSPDKSASMSNRHGISRWHFLSQLATCSKIEQAASKLHTVDTLYTSRINKCGMDDIGMCIIMYILYMVYLDDATLPVHPKIFQTELAAPARRKKNTRLGHLSAIESWILFLASGRKLSNQGVCT